MTGDQIIYTYARFLGVLPTPGEIKHAAEHVSELVKHNCYLQVDARIFSEPKGTRRNLLIYSSCHAEQLCTYLNKYRGDVLDGFYLHIFFSHRAALNAPGSNNRLVHAVFSAADLIIWNDLALEKFGAYSTDVLGKHCKTDVKIVSFVPPSCACWWPLTEHHNEGSVIAYLEAGKTVEQITVIFLAGYFNYDYEARFKSQIERLQYREAHRDVKISAYIMRHYRTHRQFLTYNHMSFHLASYIAEEALGCLGFRQNNEDHSLNVGWNEAQFGNSYPDHQSMWDFYKFEYPMDLARERGGPDLYYPTVIREAAARWEARSRQPVFDDKSNDY